MPRKDFPEIGQAICVEFYHSVGTCYTLGELWRGEEPEVKVDIVYLFCFSVKQDVYGTCFKPIDEAKFEPGDSIEVAYNPQSLDRCWIHRSEQPCGKWSEERSQQWLRYRQRIDQPTDPFKNNVRKFIPVEAYWELHDRLAVSSLCEQNLNEVAESILQKRIEELSAAEREHGFVFAAELRWLKDSRNAAPGSCVGYGEWLKQIFNEELLDVPLKFGGNEEDPDLWYGAVVFFNQRLPQLNGSEFEQEYADWIWHGKFGLFVAGEEDGISPGHLPTAFEKLHNLPYYFLKFRDRWTSQKYGDQFLELRVDTADDPAVWEVVTNEEAGTGPTFRDREWLIN